MPATRRARVAAAVRLRPVMTEALEGRVLLAAELAVEINPYPGSIGVSGNLTRAGDRVFYVANDGIHGTELWTSDGTAAGTAMIADLTPGSGSTTVNNLVAAGNLVYFKNVVQPPTPPGTPPLVTETVWRTDGTAAGTFPVGSTGSYDARFQSPGRFEPAGDKLYFDQALEAVSKP